MTKEIPEWSKQRACDLVNACIDVHSPKCHPGMASPSRFPSLFALARYISEHEEPPVDPVAEAINEIHDWWSDGGESVAEAITKAIKRGIEIGAANG